MATAAAHGSSFFLSYQCAAAVKAVSSVATVTHAAAIIAVAVTTVVATTPAVAKVKIKRSLGLTGVSFWSGNKIILKVKD